jgi:uncharacterized glyoxalase superfamily protein PhnB
MTFKPLGLIPLVGVFDMTESLAFYRDILGFEIVSASPQVDTPEGHFSHWVWLRFGAAELMLNTQYDSGERPQRPDAARAIMHGDTCFYIGCADVDQAYTALTARGLKAEPPIVASYGLRLFRVKDPDGYMLVFQQTT